MNNPTYTDRQVALQAAVEYSKTSGNINSSFDVVMVAERFRKFLEEGIVEQKNKIDYESERRFNVGVNYRPRVGNG